jgi:hypothetical protein
MKTIVPENLKGKELFKFLVENKGLLIATKKAAVKTSDPVHYDTAIITPTKTVASKALQVEEVAGRNTVDVKVVANTAWFCDSQMDVLTDKAYEKTVKEKGTLIPHIADHIHKSTSHVADVKAVYTQLISLKDLGLDMAGSTTALIFESTVREDYNADTFKFYKNGKINQHSIGLLYVSIGLCINDKDYLPEYEMWNKYYPQVINKEVVDERGYFWIVPEIKLLENSCVLFGANSLTPTLDVKTDTSSEPSDLGTQEEPSKGSAEIGYDVSKLFMFN